MLLIICSLMPLNMKSFGSAAPAHRYKKIPTDYHSITIADTSVQCSEVVLDLGVYL